METAQRRSSGSEPETAGQGIPYIHGMWPSKPDTPSNLQNCSGPVLRSRDPSADNSHGSGAHGSGAEWAQAFRVGVSVWKPLLMIQNCPGGQTN